MFDWIQEITKQSQGVLDENCIKYMCFYLSKFSLELFPVEHLSIRVMFIRVSKTIIVSGHSKCKLLYVSYLFSSWLLLYMNCSHVYPLLFVLLILCVSMRLVGGWKKWGRQLVRSSKASVAFSEATSVVPLFWVGFGRCCPAFFSCSWSTHTGAGPTLKCHC